MTFPSKLRRYRSKKSLRNLFKDFYLQPNDLIYPMIIAQGRNRKDEIPSMPSIFLQTIDHALHEIDECLHKGIQTFYFYGVPDGKDPHGSSSRDIDGVMQVALTEIKARFKDDLTLIADTCLCHYTTHSHCGIVLDGKILNTPSIEAISETALSLAQAGADIVAPSDMNDGKVENIRWTLDNAGYEHTLIMSHAAVFESPLHRPLRLATKSELPEGERDSYQLGYTSFQQAIREIALDIEEGADIIAINPANQYLDIVLSAKNISDIPIAGFSASGYYAMLKQMLGNDYIDYNTAMLEEIYSIKRAGADFVVTFFAKEAIDLLEQAT